MSKITEASPAEFSKIPLDFIIATPLLTTINAHRVAAQTTLEFVKGLLIKEEGKDTMPNVTFTMKVKQKDAQGQETMVDRVITVPLITLVKVPSLNFDSLSVSFNYNISQIVKEETSTKEAAKVDIGTKGLLGGLLSASLVGSVDHAKSVENTVNRGGSLEVKIHVSESALPAGLEKIIRALVENIETPIPAPKD
jgi:hypothetical protein